MNQRVETTVPAMWRLVFRHDYFRIILMALAYFLAHKIAFLFPDQEKVIMLVWPAGGIGLAAFLLNPRRLWPALTVAFYSSGIMADVFLGDRSFMTGVGYMTGNMVESIGCAWLILRWAGNFRKFTRLSEILALIAGTVFVNAFSSCIGAGTSVLTRGASFVDAWQSWYIADGLGILLIGPFIIAWLQIKEIIAGFCAPRALEGLACATVWTIVIWLIFNPSPLNSHLHSYILVPLLAWPAIRFGQRGVTLALMLLFAIAIVSPAIIQGPSPWDAQEHILSYRLLDLQLFLGFMAIVGYLLSAGYADLMRARELLHESEVRHRTILLTAMDGFWMADLQGRLRDVNAAYCRMSGYSEAELLTMGIGDLEAVETVDDVVAHIRKILAQGEDRFETRHRRKDGSVYDVAISVQYQTADGGRLVMFLQDITERKRREAELLQKNDEITRFLYTASHDLRSPLVTISAFLGYLEEDVKSGNSAGVAKAMSFIKNATHKMATLLDELLSLSRVGRKVNLPEETSLQTIARAAVDLVAGRITQRGVAVTITDQPVMLYGDTTRLVELFQNLIDNAVKFMGDQPQPQVEIGARQDEGNLTLFIRDNGMGIDPSYHHKLFGIFEKLETGTDGVGMGLAIVKRIVEVHGGKIWLESAGAGQGTTFYFHLARTHLDPESHKSNLILQKS